MTSDFRITRRMLMAGVASCLPSQSVRPTFAAVMAGNSVSRTSSLAEFRAAGGQVAVFFFGGWTQFGQSSNPAPWYWINHGFQERLPIRSVSLPAHWLGWTFDAEDTEYALVGAPGSANVNEARIAHEDGLMVFEPTGLRPEIRSPNFHAGVGSDFPAVKFQIERGTAKLWRCAISFTTHGSPSRVCRVEVSEPKWENAPVEIFVDMSKNEEWMKGDIRNVAIELGIPGDGTYLLHGRFELVPSPTLSKALEEVKGLPQDKQWAADWQQAEAQAHGVDIFFMCTYWDGGRSFNQPVHDAMFASMAAPSLKLGLYFDTSASRRPRSIAEFDVLLQYWNTYFANARYWRIDGRPVLGWHNGELTRDFLSEIPEFKNMSEQGRLKAMVDHMQSYFRESPDSNARSGLYLVSGFMVDESYWTGDSGGKVGVWEQAGFNAGTIYNQFHSVSAMPEPVFGTAPERPMSYSDLDEVYRRSADWITTNSNSHLRYFMPAIAGWDVRPWSVIAPRKSAPCAPAWRCNPNQSQFRQHLAGVRNRAMFATKGHSAPPGPVVMINAWDEFGEGGFICPTRGYGRSRLEAIRDTFGPSSTNA